MPYGVDKKQGGDSKENTSWMERCVSKVEKSGKDESSAIAICKAQLKKNKEKASTEEAIEIDAEVLNKYNSFREQWIRKSMNTGKTYNEASNLFPVYLSINNYIIR